MNIIRTRAVELTVIPAIAYKQKLLKGGAGMKLMRLDQEAAAMYTIDKRTGDAAPFGVVDEALFPYEAFEEAAELTSGLPYSARGKIKFVVTEECEAEDVPEDAPPQKICMADSAEYQAIVDRYSDEKGKLNYQLMNKDFIQFASKSKTVSKMVGERAKTEDILLFVVKSRAALVAGKKESLDEELAAALIETLDEIDPRSAFKELKAHIKRLLAKVK
ncbi:MAG: hypothetical protein FWE68_00130 [Defluviitaleaceae bacterium]|nr:hypothetical protein [Defluviitaleaceae bacterium]